MEETAMINEPKKRPNFLTILCILSFIGSGGLGVLYTLYQHFTFHDKYETQAAEIQEAIDQMEANNVEGFFYESSQSGLESLQITYDNLNSITLSNLFFAILSLLGVFLMFQLKKNGYYLYTVTNVFWLLVPLYFFGFGTMTLIQTGVGALITILFISMYAANLKHMA